MLEHGSVAALAGVVGWGLALVATPQWIRPGFEEYSRQFFEPGSRCLVQGSVACGLGHIYIRSLVDQNARRLRVAAQSNTGMQRLIVHWVVREAMQVRTVAK